MTGYKVYQGNQIDGAGPLGLVLLTYEALYKALARTRIAIQAGDIVSEAEQMNRAMEALIELATNLNKQEGGQLADNLASLYVYMMNRLTEGLCTDSTGHVDEVLKLTQELREGWMHISAQQKREHLSGIRQAA